MPSANLPLVYKYGTNFDVDQGVAEDIWPVGGNYPFQTSAVSLEAVSNSANDTAAGTGMRTIIVELLDGNYDPVEQTVTMNGVTPVAIPGTYLRCSRAYGDDVGILNENTGDIDIQVAGGGDILARIPLNGGLGYGQTQQLIYTVPNNFRAEVSRWNASLSGKTSADVEVTFLIRLEGKAWRVGDQFAILASGDSSEDRGPQDIGVAVLPPKTDVRVRADSNTNNVAVSGYIAMNLRRLEDPPQ